MATLEIDAAFDGGTGKYEDATGTYHASFKATRLVPDAMNAIGHGAFSGTTTGTID